MATPGAVRVVETELVRYRHVWTATAFTTMLLPVLYLAALGFGLGGLVDRAPGDVAAVGYTPWLGIGLLAAASMQTGASEANFGVFAATTWRGQWRNAVRAPLGPGDVLAGHVLWTVGRVTLTAVVLALVLVAARVVPAGSAAAAVLPAVAGGVATALPLMALVVRLERPDALNLLQRFLVLPMFLLAGTFTPLELLPGPLEVVGALTPLWSAAELARAAALGLAPAWPVAWHVGVLAAWSLLGAAGAAVTFRARLGGT